MEDTRQPEKTGARSFFSRVWAFISRHRKLFIFLIIAVIIATIVINMLGNASSAASAAPPPQLLTLERMDLQQVVSGTGTLQSTTTREVTSSLSYDVAEIYVEVGQQVTLGQALARLDTTTLDKNIADAKKSIADAVAADALALSQAERKLQDAENTRTINWNKNEKTVQDALTALNNANAAQSAAKSTLDAAEAAAKGQAETSAAATATSAAAATAGSQATAAADTAQATAGDPVQIAYNAWQADLGNGALEVAYRDAWQAAYDAAYTPAYNTAYTAEYDAAYATALDAARAAAGIAGLQADYSSKTAAASTAQTTYDKAVEARDTAYRNDSISIENYQDSIDSQKLKDSAASYRTQLENYLKDREACVIEAPVPGTVTASTAEVDKSAGGSSMSAAGAASTALFTIEDTARLEVTASIPEYDAILVAAGMPVSLTSDAISGEEWRGVVKSVSPKATGDNGSFTVVVEVTSPVGELAIGMSAKLNIITSAKNDVFAVPYDAVTTNEAGESVVMVYNESAPVQSGPAAGGGAPARRDSSENTAAPVGTSVVVTTGMETDYYIEISGDGLQAGMVLLADPEGKNVSTATATTGFPMGGGF